MLEEHVSDSLPGYALGCLDQDELLRVARHLAVCPLCCQELITYQKTAASLAYSAPLATPAVGLKEKVLKRVLLAVNPVAAPEKKEMVRTNLFVSLLAVFSGRGRWALGALALVLIVFLGIYNLVLGNEINDLRAQIPQNVSVVSLEATSNAPGSSGYLMVFKDENYGVLAVRDIPTLDAAHQYQLWLVRDGKRTSGGVFSAGDNGYGALKITADQPLTYFQSFGITIEPVGGSPQPTGKKILGSKL